MKFKKWFETFVEEKGIDKEEIIEVEGNTATNFIPVGCIIEMILGAPDHEQKQIKNTIVKIDFCNGDVVHFFKHLAKAVAQ